MKFTAASILAIVATAAATPMSSYPAIPTPTPTPSSIINLSTGYPAATYTPTSGAPMPPMGTGYPQPPSNGTSITYSPGTPPTGSPTGPPTIPSGGAAVHGVGIMAVAGAAAAYLL